MGDYEHCIKVTKAIIGSTIFGVGGYFLSRLILDLISQIISYKNEKVELYISIGVVVVLVILNWIIFAPEEFFYLLRGIGYFIAICFSLAIGWPFLLIFLFILGIILAIQYCAKRNGQKNNVNNTQNMELPVSQMDNLFFYASPREKERRPSFAVYDVPINSGSYLERSSRNSQPPVIIKLVIPPFNKDTIVFESTRDDK